MSRTSIQPNPASRVIGVRITDDQYVEIQKDFRRRKAKDSSVPRVYTLSSHIRLLIDIGLTASKW